MTYFLLHKLTRFCYNFKGLLTQVNTPVKVSLIYKSRIILLFCRTFTAIRIIWQETDFLHVGCSRLWPDSSARHQWANRPSVAEKALLTCFWPGLPAYQMEDEEEEEEEKKSSCLQLLLLSPTPPSLSLCLCQSQDLLTGSFPGSAFASPGCFLISKDCEMQGYIFVGVKMWFCLCRTSEFIENVLSQTVTKRLPRSRQEPNRGPAEASVVSLLLIPGFDLWHVESAAAQPPQQIVFGELMEANTCSEFNRCVCAHWYFFFLITPQTSSFQKLHLQFLFWALISFYSFVYAWPDVRGKMCSTNKWYTLWLLEYWFENKLIYSI